MAYLRIGLALKKNPNWPGPVKDPNVNGLSVTRPGPEEIPNINGEPN